MQSKLKKKKTAKTTRVSDCIKLTALFKYDNIKYFVVEKNETKMEERK